VANQTGSGIWQAGVVEYLGYTRKMNREDFEKFVTEGIDRIPERFLEKIANVAVLIEDKPSDEQLRSVGMDEENGDTLLGLYEGVSNLEGGHTHRSFPDRITIFRLPILETAEHNEDIPAIVADTVRHEIAHHFGMDDDDIERAEKST
jgi:predicted Zn-dependent protease with MMP-like domain